MSVMAVVHPNPRHRHARSTHGFRCCLTVFITLIYLATTAHAAVPTDNSTDIAKAVSAVEQANTAFNQAYAGRDLWAMSRLWTKADYVSAIHPAHPTPFLNWENVRSSWKQTFDHNRDITIRSLAGFVHVAGPVAWVIDSIRLEAFQTQTGQPIVMDNILTTKIFEKQGGKWLLSHYHAHLPKLTTPNAEPFVPFYPEANFSKAAAAVAQSNEVFNVALLNSDSVMMEGLWADADYVTAIHPDFPLPFLGPQNVRSSWEQLFAGDPQITLDHLGRAFHVAGRIAWVIEATGFQAVWPATDREILYMGNLLTTKIYEKHGDRWLLIHYHGHRGPESHTH